MLLKAFLRGAQTNFFYCLLQAEKDPNIFASQMHKYHARDIHVWDRGQCGFHSLKDCTCGNCADDNVVCSGKDHHTKHFLTCPFHALVYEIECCSRADQASHIIYMLN